MRGQTFTDKGEQALGKGKTETLSLGSVLQRLVD